MKFVKVFPLLLVMFFSDIAAERSNMPWSLSKQNEGHSHHGGKAYSFQDLKNSMQDTSDEDNEAVGEKAKSLLKLRILSDFTKYKSINLKFLGR